MLQKKIDNRRKTGAAGGVDCKLTDIDMLVLDIIGKESPVIQSLGVSETSFTEVGAEDFEETVVPEASTYEVVESVGECSELVSAPITVEAATIRNKKRKGSDSRESLSDEALLHLKKKLQVECLQKDSYLKSLQILKLERELHLPSSKYTESMYNVQNDNC